MKHITWQLQDRAAQKFKNIHISVIRDWADAPNDVMSKTAMSKKFTKAECEVFLKRKPVCAKYNQASNIFYPLYDTAPYNLPF